MAAKPDSRARQSAHGQTVICSACGERIDVHGPLPAEGWQVIHRCAGQVIEGEAIHAGEPPWAWRAHEEATGA